MRRALLALLAACAPAYGFHVDPRFSADDVAGIQRAADQWNARSRHRITLQGGTWRVLRQEGPLSAADDGGAVDVDWNGECSRSRRTVWIHPQSSQPAEVVALHEFGHALGLGHTATGLMMATTVSTEFTPEVMAECRRAGACR